MSILLVDVGNTRVKWAVLRGRKMDRGRALAHERDASVFASLMRLAPRDVERIVAVSVAGRTLDRALEKAALARFGVKPEFLASSRRAGGVSNGYRDVWRLGADRWVSSIGAHDLARGRAVLLANAGTALTIDLVTADGRHRGGAIVPGPATMVESLLAGTHGIRRRASGLRANDRALFARDTASALAAGSQFAAAAFIDRAFTEAAALLGMRPLLLLSGGGAAGLKRRLRSPAREVPDLVLHGLAVCARTP